MVVDVFGLETAARIKDDLPMSDPGTATPNLNAHAERFVRTIKEDCLERMIFFGEDALRQAVQEFVAHYHLERNHQGLGNRLIVPIAAMDTTGTIERRQRLGGLLNYYFRKAA